MPQLSRDAADKMLIRVSPRSMLAAHRGSVLRLPFHSCIGDRPRRGVRRKAILRRELGEASLFGIGALKLCCLARVVPSAKRSAAHSPISRTPFASPCT